LISTLRQPRASNQAYALTLEPVVGIHFGQTLFEGGDWADSTPER
jgi:hypothetical protein